MSDIKNGFDKTNHLCYSFSNQQTLMYARRSSPWRSYKSLHQTEWTYDGTRQHHLAHVYEGQGEAINTSETCTLTVLVEYIW